MKPASDSMQELHANRASEYCRIYCTQTDCTDCMGFYISKKEVPVMAAEAVDKPKSSGFWDCPGCHQVVPEGERDDHVANCEEYSMLSPDEQIASMSPPAPKPDETEEKTEEAPEKEAEEPEPAEEAKPKIGRGHQLCGYQGCEAVIGCRPESRKKHMREVHGIAKDFEAPAVKPAKRKYKKRAPAVWQDKSKGPLTLETSDQQTQEQILANVMRNEYMHIAAARTKAVHILLSITNPNDIGELLTELYDLRAKVREQEQELIQLREKAKS